MDGPSGPGCLYLHHLDEIDGRLQRLDAAIHVETTESERAPVIQALQALRGVEEVTATTWVAEIGEFRRFKNPKQLMAYAGLVPREYFPAGGVVGKVISPKLETPIFSEFSQRLLGVIAISPRSKVTFADARRDRVRVSKILPDEHRAHCIGSTSGWFHEASLTMLQSLLPHESCSVSYGRSHVRWKVISVHRLPSRDKRGLITHSIEQLVKCPA